MANGKYEKWLSGDGLLKLGAWARNGLTNEQIAHNIGVSRKTLQEWLKKFDVLRETLARDRETADIEVENAVFKRACGYTAKVKKHMSVNGKIHEVEDEVHVPPDVKAQMFWLKYRKPEVWNNAAENTAETGGIVEIPAALPEEKTPEEKQNAAEK